MKIVVCVKRVPDTEARLRIAADGRSIDAAGIKFVTNPYDEFAVEAALRLRDAAGSGEVVALSVGGAEAAEPLRAALSMGADGAVFLKAEGAPEGLAVARAIAAELGSRDYDLVLFGMKAIDDDLQAVGAMVAELMRLPAATMVTEARLEEGKLVADREVEGGVEVVELRTPALMTITKGAYQPRRPSLQGIMAAKKKPLEEKPAELGDAVSRVDALSYPPERKPGRVVADAAELVRLLREEAKVL